MKSTHLLSEHHKHLMAASNVLAAMAMHSEGGQTVNEKDLTDLLRFLEEFGDRHHQGIEEGVLFPALLRDPAQKNYHRLCSLVFEHERQRSLVDGLRDCLLTRNTKDFAYYAGRLNELLRAHIKDEEETLFPLVEAVLSPPEDERLEAEMRGYDKVWQEKELTGQLQRLSNLLTRYQAGATMRSA
jgi:hemerythrin-like domain-containing protein